MRDKERETGEERHSKRIRKRVKERQTAEERQRERD